MKSTRLLCASVVLALTGATAVRAVDIRDTRLLSQPAVSDRHVAFAYAGDLWIANLDGSGVRRLTTHPGFEVSPRFSPDGRWLAFSGNYDGNVDVYLVSVEGGEPTRLTWHPGPDTVQGFTPDGRAVLFRSPRGVYTGRHNQLFTVSVEGGFPERLPIPHAFKATFSPDGSKVAYLPLYEAFNQWKHYRGGTTSRIWIYDRVSHGVTQVPQPPERANDTDPVWMGDKIYFRSDRSRESKGEFNLFSYDPASGKVEQLTRHTDYPVEALAGARGRIVYEQAGYLHRFDPATGESRRLVLGVAADLQDPRPRFVEGAEFIRNAELSPSGARAAFEVRGEIVTVPAEKGDVRPLTETPGSHERSPAWSPDGKWIAYVTDQSGEYRIAIAPQDGKGEVRTFEPKGGGFYEDLRWSPDGKKISYSDNSWSLYVLDVASGAVTRVASEPYYGPGKSLHHAWSPDSRFLAFTRLTPTLFRQVHIYSMADGKTTAITEGLSDVTEPVFDASGKYLFFFGSTDAGPVRTWFAQSNTDMELTRSLYLAVLGKDEPSPIAKESDEEKGNGKDAQEPSKDGEDKDGKNGEGGKDGKGETEKKKPEVRVVIDFEGLHQRIQALPVPAANYVGLTPGDEGQLYFGEFPPRFTPGGPPSAKLKRFDLKKREVEELAPAVRNFALSEDHKKMLIQTGDSWHIVDAGKVEAGKGKIATGEIRIKIDPRREWEQIFHETWRINRDFFYDPGMHGADWPAMRERYAVFLPHLTDRNDLTRVLRWMCSELAVGHSYLFGGDEFRPAEMVPGGLLGSDYEIHQGRYRFTRVLGGLNWNPDLRSPLTEPGVNVRAGEYLLAVNGVDLRPPTNLFSRFENTAGKIIELTVGPDPEGAGSRTVRVVPIEDELPLRNRAWVEGNLQRVEEATGGRVAYVYVPNTAGLGHTYFKRYFFPQAHKQAIIVDERHNGGGQVADYYIDLLRRPLISYWTTRYGEFFKSPLASIQGPKVMLIDETAGSGGDLLPWMFRKFGLGPLVGRRTWGGLVGILGFPVLLDGGNVTAPNLAFWTPEDGYAVENEGVPPDIEVEQLPAEIIAGRDPQLEKAIEVVLQELEKTPPPEITPPPFPVRVWK
jgi:tricorn protease